MNTWAWGPKAGSLFIKINIYKQKSSANLLWTVLNRLDKFYKITILECIPQVTSKRSLWPCPHTQTSNMFTPTNIQRGPHKFRLSTCDICCHFVRSLIIIVCWPWVLLWPRPPLLSSGPLFLMSLLHVIKTWRKGRWCTVKNQYRFSWFDFEIFCGNEPDHFASNTARVLLSRHRCSPSRVASSLMPIPPLTQVVRVETYALSLWNPKGISQRLYRVIVILTS